jgi:predicted secreted protein
MQITQAENGQSIQVNKGDTFDVVLSENPSTRHIWTLQSVNDAILELTGSNYVPDFSPLIGSGGKRTWTFRAVAQGATPIHLTSEPLGDAANNFQVNITVF